MNDFNKVILTGRLGKDCELKYTPTGTAITNFPIAVNRTSKKEGQTQQECSFFDIVVIGKSAENCSQYLSKGSFVLIEGRLRQNVWEKDGKRRSRVEVIADNVQFLSRNNQGSSENNQAGPQNPDGDIPF